MPQLFSTCYAVFFFLPLLPHHIYMGMAAWHLPLRRALEPYKERDL